MSEMGDLTRETGVGKHGRSFPPKKSILVIDDCSDMLALQKVILEMDGFGVVTARSGTEAFGLLEQIDEPDLILLDLRLEDMSGSDFLLQLEARRPEIVKSVPVVFHTAMPAVPKSKAVGFIRKPAELGFFLESVRGFAGRGGRSAAST